MTVSIKIHPIHRSSRGLLYLAKTSVPNCTHCTHVLRVLRSTNSHAFAHSSALLSLLPLLQALPSLKCAGQDTTQPVGDAGDDDSDDDWMDGGWDGLHLPPPDIKENVSKLDELKSFKGSIISGA